MSIANNLTALADYQDWLNTIKQRVPDNLRGALPTVEEIEKNLQQLHRVGVA